MKITAVDRFTLQVPFTPRAATWNALLVWNWSVIEITRVSTDTHLVGWGETLPHYTWSLVTDEAIARCIGRPPGELLGDDSLGAGLQMAIYDIVGKALEVPVWRLFARPLVREWCPIAWWSTKMSPTALAEEAKEAVSAGYRHHKFKARPFLDVYAQVSAISAVTPVDYKAAPDFNDMLLNVGNAIRVLKELDGYEKVALYEGPLPQRDVEGYRRLRVKVDRPIAVHFGVPPTETALRSDMCDSFVLSECGAVSALSHAAVANEFAKPFWLQGVGTGLTTAWLTHLSAVSPAAYLPFCSCVNIYSDDLLIEPVSVKEGTVPVPMRPGLGVDFNESVLQTHRMSAPYSLPEQRHIITVRWPGGREVSYAHMTAPRADDTQSHFSHAKYARSTTLPNRQCWEDFLSGNQPVEMHGVSLSIRVDDGSQDWSDLYARVQRGPVTKER